MKTCPNCRENAPDNASVCPRCGQSIQTRSVLGLVVRIIFAVLVSLICLGLGAFGVCAILFSNPSPVEQATILLLVVLMLPVWGLIMWALFRKKK